MTDSEFGQHVDLARKNYESNLSDVTHCYASALLIISG